MTTLRAGIAFAVALALGAGRSAFAGLQGTQGSAPVDRTEGADQPLREGNPSPTTLSADQLQALEQQVSATPNDIGLRSQLLRHYYLKRSAEARDARLRHIVWLITNAPEAEVTGSPYAWFNRRHEPEAYDEGRTLWMKNIEPRTASPATLANAARFFMAFERGLATEIAKRGAELEPLNDRWRQLLTRIAALEARLEAPPKGDAAAGDTDPEVATDRYYALERSAEMARRAGEDQKAREYANELLRMAAAGPHDWNYGNAIHEGNRILGHLALRQGDVATAKEHLLKAGATFGSPTLNSFGPPLTLANDLLAVGEAAVVVEYLQLCSRFWRGHDEAIRDWISRIRAGEKPELNRFRASHDN